MALRPTPAPARRAVAALWDLARPGCLGKEEELPPRCPSKLGAARLPSDLDALSARLDPNMDTQGHGVSMAAAVWRLSPVPREV